MQDVERTKYDGGLGTDVLLYGDHNRKRRKGRGTEVSSIILNIQESGRRGGFKGQEPRTDYVHSCETQTNGNGINQE